MDSINGAYLGVNPPTGANARGARRARLKSQGRLKKAKAPLQNNDPADVRVIILYLVCFLAALFLVTKLALGL